jgi:hypothetical protein
VIEQIGIELLEDHFRLDSHENFEHSIDVAFSEFPMPREDDVDFVHQESMTQGILGCYEISFIEVLQVLSEQDI